MADIARRAGVSRAAVSYAVSGRAGVSDVTRQRVLRIAAEMGFEPSNAAKAMGGGSTGSVGLVLRRPTGSLSVEAFRRQFISGVEAALLEHSYGLLIQFVADRAAELEVYEQWWAQRSVDGFLLLSLCAEDPRVQAFERMSASAVVVGGPDEAVTLPNLWTDDGAAITQAVEHLVGLGHRRIARAAGPQEMLHVAMRERAFEAVCERLGIADEAVSVPGGYSREEGQHLTRGLLSSTVRPTAIIYDNDVAALAGLAVAAEMGFDVPGEISLVGWEDSPLCEVVRPGLTVLRRDIVRYGHQAAQMLMDAIRGGGADSIQGETPRLKVRGSTGPAPGVM
ncbi:LacI family DNA-binding transcriptional regulator [Streptomyces aculeolatus]